MLAYYPATQTGKFSMYMQRMTKPSTCSALTFAAAPLAREIASAGAVDCFTYSGTTGALVDPVVVSGKLAPETDIFSPAGVSQCATPGELHDCAISAAGRWTTLIWDSSSTGTGTGTFTISAADLDLTPVSGPAGTAVTVSSGGFKSGETVKVSYQTGLASPADVVICHGTASAAGSVSCSGSIPASKAGPAGRHVVQAAGSATGRTTSGTFTRT